MCDSLCKHEPNLSGWAQCLRWSLFVLNFLAFWLAIAVIILFMVLSVSSAWGVFQRLNPTLNVILFVLLSFVVCTTFNGSMANCNLRPIVLLSYICLALMVVISMLTLVVLVASDTLQVTAYSSTNTESNSLEWLERKWGEMKTKEKKRIQKEFDCCGLNSEFEDNGETECDTSKDYCQDDLIDFLSETREIIEWTSVCLLMLCWLGMCVACGLYQLSTAGDGFQRDNAASYSRMPHEYQSPRVDEEEDGWL